MGTCLAVIKIIGTTSLGIYTGTVFSNQLTNLDILKKTLLKNTYDIRPLQIIKEHLMVNAFVLAIFGSVSTIAFQLSFFGAPPRLQHPYLIYSSLVFPISAAIYGSFNYEEFIRLINFDSLVFDTKKTQEIKSKKVKKEKKQLRSDLDNSVYKDLGESNSEEEEIELAAVEEDEEISNEVEAHLEKKTALKVIESLKLSNAIVLGVSFTGLLITAIGLYGDH